MSFIKKSGTSGLTAWIPVNNVEGFDFHLRFVSRAEFQKLYDKYVTTVYDMKTSQHERKVNNVGYRKNYIQDYVVGWRGLTYRNIHSIVEVDPAQLKDELDKRNQALKLQGSTEVVTLDSEIPYSPEFCEELVSTAYMLEKFILDSSQNIALFQEAGKLEAEIKN